MKQLRKYLLFILLCALACQSVSAQYDKDVFYFRGRQALSEGKFAQSIENFNTLARLDTTDHWTYFYRGIAKYNLGDIRGAFKDFDHSIRINPLFTSGYHYRAITESRNGNYDKALSDLETAIALRPGYTGLYFSRGVTYFLSQQFEKAVTDFNRYIRKEPKDPSAYMNRGASLLFLKDTTAALADYNKAVSLDRFDPEGYIRRGRLYASMKNYGRAVDDFNKALQLDSANTFVYFNRALIYYDLNDYNSAMADLNRVLKEEPGNALTLYNRSLINAQVGNYSEALDDIDRVIGINPKNVLAYFNRASFFIQMERWSDALADYNKAIELYPDFAKAYMNRSYVESQLGMMKASKQDYQTAQQKVREYRERNAEGTEALADTTAKFNSLLALDADFAKKDFDNELLQHRDIDIRLKPLYRFILSKERGNINYALSTRHEDALLDKFTAEQPVAIRISDQDSLKLSKIPNDAPDFIKALSAVADKRYNQALSYYDKAAASPSAGKYEELYKAYYLMNRAVLRAEMIDFMSSIENNVQTLTMDDKGTTRARVNDRAAVSYDYSEAIGDLLEADRMVPGQPYILYNLANLYCLSSQLVESIDNYNKAISIWPAMANAYFNRGLVLILLKDKEKGCIDLSHAGELGIADAYGVIKKYCEEEEQ